MGARLIHARKKAKRRAHAEKRKSQENVAGGDNEFHDRNADARRAPAQRRPPQQ